MSLEADFRAGRGSFELAVKLELRAGEVLAVVGENGAGKSTLLAALAGLIPLRAGEICLDGRVLERVVERGKGQRLPPQARGVGMLFQGLALFEHMSAVDNVAYGPRSRGVAQALAQRDAREWLARLGIEGELAERRPSALSGGQAQRVALARALITAPRVLLLDEPSSGLDVRSLAAARELLAQVLADFSGVSVLVTHSLDEALALGDRLLVLERGRIACIGSPAALVASSDNELLAAMRRTPGV